MGDRPTTGRAGAVADAMEEAGPDLLPLPDATQLELLRDGLPDRDPGRAVAEARKAGRPKGARNKRTEEFRRQILAMAPHPALALARAYARPVETLAAELGCSKLEAFREQRQCAAELLPYVEGKMPVKVDLDVRAGVTIEIESLDRALDGGLLAGAGVGDFEDAEIAEFQPVSEDGE